jgi:hypothetical protein
MTKIERIKNAFAGKHIVGKRFLGGEKEKK